MTFVLTLDLYVIKMYVCTENEVPSFIGSKVLPKTRHRQTDKQMDMTENIT